MPRFDGTGPMGQGPMTGWGRGSYGRGLAWRRGWCWQDLTKEEKLRRIAIYKKNLDEEMKSVEEQEKELNKE